jgi:hypothetical protein
VTGPTWLRSVDATAPDFVPESSAFDFRGTGPDWLRHHGDGVFGCEGLGEPYFATAVPLAGGWSMPLVVDADNNGSADILVRTLTDSSPVDERLQMYSDALGRPSPARRIWNQSAYMPGAIREDGRVPAQAVMPWKADQGFRAQARVACAPAPR